MSNPLEFGWNQLLTLFGLLMTIAIAIGWFRSFGRWKREKIEERRIETAIDALALVYESKFVFDYIRSEMAYDYEWKECLNALAWKTSDVHGGLSSQF